MAPRCSNLPAPGLPALGLLAALVASGCEVSRPAGPLSSLRPTPELAAINPADVAVLPVEDAVPGVDLRDLTAHFQRRLYLGLIDRNYSPISLRRVQAVLRAEQEAGGVAGLQDLRGKFGEQALLAVRITGFQERSLVADGRVRISSEVRLLDSQTLANLWSGGYELETRVSGRGLTAMELEDLRRQAVDRYVESLLLELPARIPLGAGRSQGAGREG